MTAVRTDSAGFAAFPYHGGAIDVARRLAPEAPEPWIDLSTGINPHAYPLPDLAPDVWIRLPAGEALAGLEAVTRNKALTDRAAKLDADIVALRDKIEKAGPVLEANSQGSALARLFDMPDTKAATLSTYQNLAMAMVIEFLIVISLVASEVIEQHERRQAPAASIISTVLGDVWENTRPLLPFRLSVPQRHRDTKGTPS